MYYTLTLVQLTYMYTYFIYDGSLRKLQITAVVDSSTEIAEIFGVLLKCLYRPQGSPAWHLCHSQDAMNFLR